MYIISKLLLIVLGFIKPNSIQKLTISSKISSKTNINMNDNYSLIKRENESINFLNEYRIEKRLKELRELRELNDYMNN